MSFRTGFSQKKDTPIYTDRQAHDQRPPPVGGAADGGQRGGAGGHLQELSPGGADSGSVHGLQSPFFLYVPLKTNPEKGTPPPPPKKKELEFLDCSHLLGLDHCGSS